MNRRKILQLTATTFTTGIGAGYVGNRQDGENSDEEEPARAADLQFGERELVVDESGISPTAYAAAVVENVGGTASGRVSVTAAWMDGSGNFIDDDSIELPSLGAGETWLAYVRALLTDPDEVEGFEVSGEFEVGYPRTPLGMTVTESDFDRGENVITGVAENTREADIEGLEAHGKIYDESGTVLGGGSTWEGEHAAGRDWSFEIRTPRLPAGVEPTDHDVMLDARTFQITD